jgi:hypothetical protein
MAAVLSQVRSNKLFLPKIPALKWPRNKEKKALKILLFGPYAPIHNSQIRTGRARLFAGNSLKPDEFSASLLLSEARLHGGASGGNAAVVKF